MSGRPRQKNSGHTYVHVGAGHVPSTSASAFDMHMHEVRPYTCQKSDQLSESKKLRCKMPPSNTPWYPVSRSAYHTCTPTGWALVKRMRLINRIVMQEGRMHLINSMRLIARCPNNQSLWYLCMHLESPSSM